MCMPGQGDTVPYIICVKKAEDGSVEAAKGLAERAYHPEEIADNPQLSVDSEYYLAQQVPSTQPSSSTCKMLQQLCDFPQYLPWLHARTLNNAPHVKHPDSEVA